MARRLGRAGERRFATLVADYPDGASCNDSHDDEHGWDHVVEFDNVSLPGLPADLQPSIPALFVQVKSTGNPAQMKVSVKLSNALAFTRSDNPCFLVLVCTLLDGPTSYYAIHWWDALMARALKRARELSRDGIGAETFHRKDLSFSMTAADSRAPEALIGWMKQTVLEQGRNYAGVKTALRDNLGFGEGGFGGKLKVGPIASIEQLIDHQLGLTPSIPLADFSIHQRRFNIDIPLPMPGGAMSFARMHANPAATCDVRVRGPDGESFSVEGELIVPALPDIAEELLKYRIRTPIFDLVWRPSGPASFSCQFNTATLFSPAELEKFARFFGWAGCGEIEIVATVGDMPLFGATSTLDPQPDSGGWQRIAGPIATLARLAASRKAEPPLISVEQAQEAPWLDLMHSAVVATRTTLNAAHVGEAGIPEFDHAISFAILTVGNWVFGTVMRLPLVDTERVGDGWQASFGQAILLETYAFELGDETLLERLKVDYSRYASRRGAFPIDNMLVCLAAEAG